MRVTHLSTGNYNCRQQGIIVDAEQSFNATGILVAKGGLFKLGMFHNKILRAPAV